MLRRLPRHPGVELAFAPPSGLPPLHTDARKLAQILRNTIKTTGTLEDREVKLKALFTDVAAFSDSTGL